MYVAVCIEDKPVFIMPSHPNGDWTITTSPTYYLAVTDAVPGEVLDGRFISKADKVIFNKGVEATATLNSSLHFDVVVK